MSENRRIRAFADYKKDAKKEHEARRNYIGSINAANKSVLVHLFICRSQLRLRSPNAPVGMLDKNAVNRFLRTLPAPDEVENNRM